MGFMRFLARHLAGRAGQPRVVRRVEMTCPHTGEKVRVELLMGHTGRPTAVLRCNHRVEAPPACDQACRTCVEAVMGPPLALLLVPRGDGPPEQLG